MSQQCKALILDDVQIYEQYALSLKKLLLSN